MRLGPDGLLLLKFRLYFLRHAFGQNVRLRPGLETCGLNGQGNILIRQEGLGTPPAILLLFEIDVTHGATNPIWKSLVLLSVVGVNQLAFEIRNGGTILRHSANEKNG